MHAACATITHVLTSLHRFLPSVDQFSLVIFSDFGAVCARPAQFFRMRRSASWADEKSPARAIQITLRPDHVSLLLKVLCKNRLNPSPAAPSRARARSGFDLHTYNVIVHLMQHAFVHRIMFVSRPAPPWIIRRKKVQFHMLAKAVFMHTTLASFISRVLFRSQPWSEMRRDSSVFEAMVSRLHSSTMFTGATRWCGLFVFFPSSLVYLRAVSGWSLW